MNPADIAVLTFDCYGTLIDWETGITESLGPWLEREGIHAEGEELLALFGRFESAREASEPRALYPAILGGVLRDLGTHLGARVTDEDAERFGASVGDWPAFADARSALAELGRRYRLVILSNVDRASFALSAARLGVTFDAVCTAEEIGSYKPDPRNFAFLIERVASMGFGPERILHVAQSLFHDHEPAGRMGLATMWVDRRAGRTGGATRVPDAPVEPDYTVGSMAEVVTTLERLVVLPARS